MLKITKLLIFLVVVSALGTGCSTVEEFPQDSEIQLKGVDFQVLQAISEKIAKDYPELLNGSATGSEAFRTYSASDEDFLEMLEPLIENGHAMHQEMIIAIEGSIYWNTLTFEEKEEILNLDDFQLAELSFVISSTQNISGKLDVDKAVDCLSAAMGYQAVQTIISTTGSLASVESCVAALKIVGKRTLGWVGLGIAVYSFVKCVS